MEGKEIRAKKGNKAYQVKKAQMVNLLILG